MIAMLMVSLIANFLVICLNSTKLASKLQLFTSEPPIETIDNIPAANEVNDELPNILSSYGKDYDDHQIYKASYSSCYDEAVPVTAISHSENSHTIDSLNALLSQRRTRDKRSMDGAVSKDSSFYKYYFTNELNEYESKPWWGKLEDDAYESESLKK
jgi:hypothetical protein